jgi:UDP-4-amino-4,6-dideoxy-N-acetyl-beta-L-altrosamine N-acetyltransferase
VELTSLQAEDSSLLFTWINDQALVELSAPFRPVSQAEHDVWFEQIRQRQDVRIFGIREEGRLVGSCQLHSIHPVHRSAELQIRIGSDEARGRGVGREALRQLLRYGFEELDLHRIYLHVFVTNERAIRAYERAGFRREGILREAALIDGAWIDVVLMAVLRYQR